MNLRQIRRAVALGFEIFLSIVRLWLLRLNGPRTLETRARWMGSSSRRVLERLGIRCTVQGLPPEHGMVVSNHLSYLDILVLSSVMPCFFVSKAEISRWPLFGWLGGSGGTIFLDRCSLASAQSVASQITERLKLPVAIPVLLFPEGTSSDGSQVLLFHSRLIDPAASAGAPITAASIRYVLHDGTPERELCWFGDQTFVSHLWKVLSVGGFEAEVQFGEPHIYASRRAAAQATREEIIAMREADDRSAALSL